MEKLVDLVIVGSGPAGLSAAIYAQRARLDTLVIEREMMSGGQILNTYEVDNYPGLPGIGGFDLGVKLREHADRLETQFVQDEVTAIEDVGSAAADAEELWAAEVRPSGERKVHLRQVVGRKNSYFARSIIVATGAVHRKLGVPGEAELAGAGVSYCATCDGAFFRRKVTAVVGGGDVAIEDAIFLARMCVHVFLIHRRDELRGARSLQEKLFALDNVTVIWDTVVDRIEGVERVSGLAIRNVKTGETGTLPVDGVFLAVGITPNSAFCEMLLEMEHGYIRAGEDCETSQPGIFAAGDVRTKQLRQIVTAVADGANAVASVERYLR